MTRGLPHPYVIHEGKLFLYSFLVMPNCPSLILVRDVLQKLGAHLTFGSPFPNILALLCEGETLILVEPE